MFVIDWHNLGFSILAHAPGRTTRHPLVRIARYYEHLFGRMADKHLCVTNGMRKWLNDNFGVQARVLHDRPPSFFGPTSLAGQHELFMRIGRQLRDWKVEEKYTAATGIVVGEGETLFTTFIGSAQKFTRVNNAGSRLKTDIVLRDISRPALLVSSTSWTEDEDFSVLLAALRDLDAKWAVNPSPSTGTRGSNASKPFVVVVVTGKGPLKAHYEALIRASPLQRIAICTMWLEAEDYPKLIGSADLGVSLHTSTSGVDLPMKVLDMFGCQVPVCAMGFPCLSELVRDNVNGFVFQTATELAVCLDTLLGRFPMDTSKLDQLRAGVKGMERWEGHWRRHAALYLAIKDVTKSWCVFGAWFGLLLAFVFAAIVARPG
jgi:beta-1,4-mannosyltransferase